MKELRAISTPEGTFLYERTTGTCLFTNTKKSNTWQKPLHAQIALTQQCNLQCWHCYATSTTPTTNTDMFSLLTTSNSGNGCSEWPVNRLKRLIQYLDKWGIFGIAFGGGEPFMYNHLQEITKYTWMQTGLDLSITTNGYAAKEKQIQALEDYVSEIRVSIRHLKDCKQLAKFLNRHFEVGINLLLHHGNGLILESIIETCRGLGVTDFLVNSFVPAGRGVNFANRIPLKEDYAVFAELVNKHDRDGLTFKVSGRLATNLKPHITKQSGCQFVPFQEEKNGRIIAITTDGKLKPSSLSVEAYPFKHEGQIATIYRQKIAF